MFKNKKYLATAIIAGLLCFGLTIPAYSQVSVYVQFPTFVYHDGHFTFVLGNGYYPNNSYYPSYHPHYYHKYKHYYNSGYSGYNKRYKYHDNGLHKGWYKHGNGHHGRHGRK